jgi:glutathione-regulated potassium-efflux system protein KefB
VVRNARANGHHVHFGDCKRAELLRAAGAEEAELVVVSFSDAEESVRAVRAIKHHFPRLKVLARAGHRAQSLELMDAQVDFLVREALEAALALSKAMLRQLNLAETDAQAAVDDFRDRDHDEFMAALRVRRMDSELDVRG